eukprot:1153066-Pelagomonas_calceolata.AAC.4
MEAEAETVGILESNSRTGQAGLPGLDCCQARSTHSVKCKRLQTFCYSGFAVEEHSHTHTHTHMYKSSHLMGEGSQQRAVHTSAEEYQHWAGGRRVWLRAFTWGHVLLNAAAP